MVLARDLSIHKNDVVLEASQFDQSPSASGESFGGITVADLEKRHILQTLKELGFNRTKAADQLGISIRTLRNKLNEYREQGEDIPKG